MVNESGDRRIVGVLAEVVHARHDPIVTVDEAQALAWDVQQQCGVVDENHFMRVSYPRDEALKEISTPMVSAFKTLPPEDQFRALELLSAEKQQQITQ